MKLHRIIIPLLIAICIAQMCWPNRIDHSRQYGGPCAIATWKLGKKRNLSIILTRNKYYSGVGCYLPGAYKSYCDYAVAFSPKCLYVQYPQGRSVGTKRLIDF